MDLAPGALLRLEVLLQQEGEEEEAVRLGRESRDRAVERRRVEAADDERFKLLGVGADRLAELGQLLPFCVWGMGEKGGSRGGWIMWAGCGSCY